MPWLASLFAAGMLLGCRLSIPGLPTEPIDQFPTTPPPTRPAGPSATAEISPVASPQEPTRDENQIPVPPVADPEDLARRLAGLTGPVPATLEPPAAPLENGTRDSFWVSDATDQHVQVSATLRYVTDHAYFWIEDGVWYRDRDLERLAEAFEQSIYPTNRAFFGSEWTPGIDGDPHIYILYTRGLGPGIAGYFLPGDLQHPLVNEFSNAHEIFLLNADVVSLADEFTYGLLAHEFQHMIHWNTDRDEETWINEGFAELAVWLNRYQVGGFAELYLLDTDLQLNDWPNSDHTAPSYGASYLFLSYFLHRMGRELAAELASDPANGLTAVDQVLSKAGVLEPSSGMPLGADDLVVDWAAANYLAEGSDSGILSYPNLPPFQRARTTEELNVCDAERLNRTVSQYGVDYLLINCPGERTLAFQGSKTVRLLPVDPFSGSYSFWSNMGDEIDSRLTRSFDFTGLTGPLTLSYRTWYDIEANWDFAYVLASVDGSNWDMLQTAHGTDANPTGNNYGWGYTGMSPGGEWVREEVDLSAYAGQRTQIRFEYVTDGAKFGDGLLLDDIAIPELGYFADFESGSDGWEGEGFARVHNEWPQTFRLALITPGREQLLQHVPLTADHQALIPLDLKQGEHVVLLVIGTARGTRQPADYSLSFPP